MMTKKDVGDVKDYRDDNIDFEEYRDENNSDDRDDRNYWDDTIEIIMIMIWINMNKIKK